MSAAENARLSSLSTNSATQGAVFFLLYREFGWAGIGLFVAVWVATWAVLMALRPGYVVFTGSHGRTGVVLHEELIDPNAKPFDSVLKYDGQRHFFCVAHARRLILMWRQRGATP